MAQSDLLIENDEGAAVRLDIQAALQALATLQSGSTAPSTTYAGQMWWDTSTDRIKQRNSANNGWITWAKFDGTNPLSLVAGGVDQVQAVENLADIDTSLLSDGNVIALASYHPLPSSAEPYEGGGLLVWRPNLAKSNHDGGTVFSPTVPWDWSDDGVDYLNGVGETDSGGNGVFVRAVNDTLKPEYFGARLDLESYPSIHAALDRLFSDFKFGELDGGGKQYLYGQGYTYNGAFTNKRITGLRLNSSVSFSGTDMLHFPGDGGSSSAVKRLFIDNCSFLAGGNAARCIRLNLTSGIYIHHNEFSDYTTHGILDEHDEAASEHEIAYNYFDGKNQRSATGIEINAADATLEHNLMRNERYHIVAEQDGIIITHNHLYDGNNRDEVKVFLKGSGTFSYNDLDNTKLLIEDPGDWDCKDNVWVLRNGSDWTSGAEGKRGMITLKAGAAGTDLTRVNISQNKFVTINGTGADAIRYDTTSGNFDFANMNDVFIVRNTFGRMQTITSHPVEGISFSSTNFAKVDLDKFSPFGSAYVYKTMIAIVPQVDNADLGNTIPKAHGAVFQNEAKAQTDINWTGTMVVTCTWNSNGQ
jgi:uncharacterized protein YjbI with pentapeptide repeats